MRSSREKLIASSENDSPEARIQSQQPWSGGSETQEAWEQRARAPSRDSEPAGGSCYGGSGGRYSGGALEEWEEEIELAMMSPESQKRERRRIANRDCARRIRQRKTALVAELTAAVEVLQSDNSRLLATLTEVTRCWRDTTVEICELRSQIALLQASSNTSDGSGGSGGSGSLLASPTGDFGRHLLSPGWPSPMAL